MLCGRQEPGNQELKRPETRKLGTDEKTNTETGSMEETSSTERVRTGEQVETQLGLIRHSETVGQENTEHRKRDYQSKAGDTQKDTDRD